RSWGRSSESDLLKTSENSRYLVGMLGVFGVSDRLRSSAGKFISRERQLILGLDCFKKGRPRITGKARIDIISNESCVEKFTRFKVKGIVTVDGLGFVMLGIEYCETRVLSMKFPDEPESIRAMICDTGGT
ncbi:hypothetical protein HDU92_004077, partial [Lobulomyces angularis]